MSNNLECIKNLLQKEVTFCLEQKILRRGKLLLYNANDYHLKFILKTNKDINKTYEIPYPYAVTDHNNYINLSYKVSDLCKDNENKMQYVYEYCNNRINNKLYDKKLTISIIDM